MLGDLNSRTSSKPDFIENDRPIPSRDIDGEVDTPLPRYSMDRGTNRFGDNLLELCKAVNMRIVNGRLHKDHSIGRMTCYTHNGESVVDYVLTSYSNFELISDFQVGDFIEYSNHAPISLNIKIFTEMNADVQSEHFSYTWKKVQVGKDQEKAQSEKDSHSKNRGGKKTKLTIRYLYHETYRKPNEQLFSQ